MAKEGVDEIKKAEDKIHRFDQIWGLHSTNLTEFVELIIMPYGKQGNSARNRGIYSAPNL